MKRGLLPLRMEAMFPAARTHNNYLHFYFMWMLQPPPPSPLTYFSLTTVLGRNQVTFLKGEER